MENKTREEGHYWIKHEDNWIIGYFVTDTSSEGHWHLPLSEDKFFDFEFSEINENRIVRHEPVKNANPILQLNDEMNKCGIITPDFVRRRFEQEADKLFNEDGN